MVKDNKTSVLVSFIIPIYNTNSKLLQKCIESIRSVLCSKEIILIDDGSTNDQTINLLQSYQNIKEIEVIHKKNSGPAAARNVGLDMACGKYIVFVDSDDWINSNIFSDLLLLMEKDDGDILCHTYDVINEAGIVERAGSNSGEIFQFSSLNEIRNLRDTEGKAPDFNSGLIWGKIHKGNILAHLRFDETLHYCEDNLFNMSPKLRNRKIIGVYRSAYIHLNNAESLCNKYNPKACEYFITSALKMKEVLDCYNEEADWDDFYKVVIFHFYLNNILKLDVFNSQNIRTLSSKEHIAKNILTKEPFKDALQNIKKETLSFRQRLVLMLLKKKMCWIAYHIFNFKS